MNKKATSQGIAKHEIKFPGYHHGGALEGEWCSGDRVNGHSEDFTDCEGLFVRVGVGGYFGSVFRFFEEPVFLGGC